VQYIPYHLLGGTKNIIVDGKANADTVLTLSHWPGSATPAKYKDDLSAQIVFRFLDSGDTTNGAAAVSNNHFDEDGLVGLFSMLHPGQAAEHKELLIDVAGAGDFGTYQNRDAARVSFVLQSWNNPERSPLNEQVFQSSYDELTTILYEELIRRLPNILVKIDHLERYWIDEDTWLENSEAALKSANITIEEKRELDLAIVRLPEKLENPAESLKEVCHPMAIHNATSCLRILLMQEKRFELYYRYETWVEYISRKTMPRIDLTALAARLSKEETVGKWTFDGVKNITPSLSLKNARDSRISPETFLDAVIAELSSESII